MNTIFNGIINDNNFESDIRIFFNLDSDEPYSTDAYVDDILVDVMVDVDKIIIDYIEYQYCIKSKGDEIIIVGKEKYNFFSWLISCFQKPKFFVLTNKEEV